MRSSVASPVLIVAAVAAAALLGIVAGRGATGHAQVFGPPMTAFGSIADDQGIVAEALVVEAYVGDTVCGTGATEFTGEPPGRVTVYWVDVVSREQTPGCGSNGAEVRIKIGERFAPQAVLWSAGPVRHDVTFGNATPAPIPTPTPVRDQATQPPATQPPGTSPTASGRGGDGTATPSASASPSPTGTATNTSTATATPTLAGVLVTREPDTLTSAEVDDDGGDSGFPIWAMVLIGLGTVVAAGGGIGFAMARARHEDDDGVDPPADQEP